MAATRITLRNAGKIRRETYRYFCPTCGRRIARDGRQGARNNANYCDSTCQSKYLVYARRQSFLSTGHEIEDPTMGGG